jgi:hypothetical protein
VFDTDSLLCYELCVTSTLKINAIYCRAIFSLHYGSIGNDGSFSQNIMVTTLWL